MLPICLTYANNVTPVLCYRACTSLTDPFTFHIYLTTNRNRKFGQLIFFNAWDNMQWLNHATNGPVSSVCFR